MVRHHVPTGAPATLEASMPKVLKVRLFSFVRSLSFFHSFFIYFAFPPLCLPLSLSLSVHAWPLERLR